MLALSIIGPHEEHRQWKNVFQKTYNHKLVPSVRSHGTLAMIMINLAKSCHWLIMAPLSRSWLIMIHGTLAKIMARSWQDLGKITMVCHGPCQGCHVKNWIEPFSVIARVVVEI